MPQFPSPARFRLDPKKRTQYGFAANPAGHYRFLGDPGHGDNEDGGYGIGRAIDYQYIGPPPPPTASAQAAPSKPAAKEGPSLPPPPPQLGDTRSRQTGAAAEAAQRKRKGPTSRFATSASGTTGAAPTRRASLLPAPPSLTAFTTMKSLLGG